MTAKKMRLLFVVVVLVVLVSFETTSAAKRVCRPKVVYCCVDGRLRKVTGEACKEAGGRIFISASAARSQCKPEEIYCCTKGQVTKVTVDRCKEKKGRRYQTAAEAKESCRPEDIYCCVNGKIAKMSVEKCKDNNGWMFKTASEAKQSCRRAPRKRPEPTAAPKSQGGHSTAKTYPGVKLNQGPATIPQSTAPRRSSVGAAQASPNLGRSVQSTGSAGKDMGRQNNLSGKLPEGHTVPGAGIGKRGGTAGYAKGLNNRQGFGTVKEEFADPMGPVIKTGPGAKMQSQDPGEDDTGEMPEQGNQAGHEEDFSTDPQAYKDQVDWHETFEAVKEDYHDLDDHTDPSEVDTETASEETNILLRGLIRKKREQ